MSHPAGFYIETITVITSGKISGFSVFAKEEKYIFLLMLVLHSKYESYIQDIYVRAVIVRAVMISSFHYMIILG